MATPQPPGFEYFDVPAAAVLSEIALMNERAAAAQEITLATVAQLGSLAVLDGMPAPPNFGLPDLVVPSAVTPAKPERQIFGTVDPFDNPAMDDLGATVGIDPSLQITPGAVPTAAFSFPDVPDAISTAGQPTRPTTTTVTLPSTPTTTAPPLPALEDLIVPTFSGVIEPIFTDSEPVFSGTEPTGLQYTPQQYVDALLDKIKSKISTFLDGGTGIPTIIQDALFQAARTRELQTALASEQGAFDTWAARNFAMPPGMLVEAVDTAQERSRFAENALEREILTKSAVWEIENLRHYVAQGVALEGTLMTLFNAIEQRTLDAAKAQADIEVQVYRLAVSLYEVRQTVRRINAEIYKAKWDGQVARVSAFKAEVDAVVAKGQLNDQRVRVYLGLWEGVKNAAQVFQTAMQGAQIGSEKNKTDIEGYGQDVQAWLGILKARMTPIDIFSERMKGEGIRAQALDSMVKGYVGTVQAQETEANVKMKYMDLKLQGIKVSVEKYAATLQGMRDHIQAQLANIQAQSSGYVAEVGRYREELAGSNQARALTMQTQELRLRNNLEYYATQLREFDALLARQLDRARIIVEAVKGAGQIGASLTTGAMSAIHVQAAIHGTGSVSAQNNTSTQRQISSSIDARISESFNFENPDTKPEIPMPALP